MRLPVALLVVGVLLAVSGCYGSTEPATKVSFDSAQLNAQGTANQGPARSHFEYWISGSSRVRWTDNLRWPAGARGPFSQKVTGLAASTTYSYRVCGRNESDSQDICANALSLTTGRPVEDSVVGSYVSSPSLQAGVDAHSGPSGQSPHGGMSAQAPFDPYFEGSVTCLRVSGNRAAVGAVGQQYADPRHPTDATLLMTIVDGGASADDKIYVREPQPGSTPPDCASATFGQEGPVAFGPYLGEFVVNDAP